MVFIMYMYVWWYSVGKESVYQKTIVLVQLLLVQVHRLHNILLLYIVKSIIANLCPGPPPSLSLSLSLLIIIMYHTCSIHASIKFCVVQVPSAHTHIVITLHTYPISHAVLFHPVKCYFQHKIRGHQPKISISCARLRQCLSSHCWKVLWCPQCLRQQEGEMMCVGLHLCVCVCEWICVWIA